MATPVAQMALGRRFRSGQRKRYVALASKNPLSALGKAVNFFRLDANLTQRQVADRSGRHLTHISRLEKGRVNPSYETLQDVAKGLGVTFAQVESLAGVYAQKEKR